MVLRHILARSIGGVLQKMKQGELNYINIMDYLLLYKGNKERLFHLLKRGWEGLEKPSCLKIVQNYKGIGHSSK
jgi:hypothetical protein